MRHISMKTVQELSFSGCADFVIVFHENILCSFLKHEFKITLFLCVYILSVLYVRRKYAFLFNSLLSCTLFFCYIFMNGNTK